MARWNHRLRKARESMGLSLAGAVRLLNETGRIKLTKSQLQKVEKSRSDIPTGKFRALCKMYLVSADWILDLKE
jgi:transcriptional regulator with XRE-family HTH domain